LFDVEGMVTLAVLGGWQKINAGNARTDYAEHQRVANAPRRSNPGGRTTQTWKNWLIRVPTETRTNGNYGAIRAIARAVAGGSSGARRRKRSVPGCCPLVWGSEPSVRSCAGIAVLFLWPKPTTGDYRAAAL